MTHKNLVTYNSMISVLAKNARISHARQLFDKMSLRNLVSWNSMIAGYLHNNMVEEARHLFDIMPERDNFSWALMITCYTRKGKLEKARELLELVPDKLDTACWNAMIAGYAKKGKFNDAMKVFEKMPLKDLVSYNSMLAGYTQNGKMHLALHFFDRMTEKNEVSWNLMVAGVSWTTIINGYIRVGYSQSGRMDEALDLFRQMPIKNAVSWNTMISGYAQAGQMDRATEVFQAMEERNIVSWNSLISGFLQNNLYLETIKSLVMMGQEGKKPDQSTFACAVSACANLASLQVGKQLHEYILKSGYMNDLFVSNALISMYAKCGRVQNAEQVFSDIEYVDLISWNSLISGYALNGYANEAFKVFGQMLSEQVVPDEVTFIGMLSACSHAGLANQGLDFFKCMIEDFVIEPLAEHYSCLVDLLGRMGRLEEAFNTVRGMKVKANAGLWGSLLGACRVHKNLELGRFAAERLFELEPHNASNYITLSNMLAEAGRWEEVERVRILMRDKRAGKQPGCSWIEVQNQIQHFLSHDPAKLRPENIHIILNTLAVHMRDQYNIYDMKSAFDIL
uniref:Pentatricopeptide repeat-containing protein At4g02750 family n=1 Tax=Cajanus cajan TaxID=3821 RepID=A0A151TI27_CAJCA|nr:Pentatricopeptide repeat-containing protein At4g02750 family [Cajanus cajan]